MQRRVKAKEIILWTMIVVSLLLMGYNTLLYRKVSRILEPPDPQIETGKSFAELVLKLPNGEKFVIPSEGRYLISFLTTDCDACQHQVRSLNEAVRIGGYTRVVGVFHDAASKVREFESSFKPEFLCLIDDNGAFGDLRLNSFPQTVELNQGVVQRSWVGLQDGFN